MSKSLAAIKAERGMTDRQMADAMGIRVRTYRRWEHSMLQSSSRKVMGAMKAAGIPLQWLCLENPESCSVNPLGGLTCRCLEQGAGRIPLFTEPLTCDDCDAILEWSRSKMAVA